MNGFTNDKDLKDVRVVVSIDGEKKYDMDLFSYFSLITCGASVQTNFESEDKPMTVGQKLSLAILVLGSVLYGSILGGM